jgi:inner membrane protein
MPSTIVHLAFAGLLASALLGAAFDRRALVVVLAITAIPDLDSFIALYSTAGHRAVLHNAWIPLVGAALLWVDVTVRDQSFVLDRWGDRGVRILWVSFACYLFAHVSLDLVNGLVNVFWPVHDQFYHLDGTLELSDQRGIVQTFFETGGDGGVPAPEGAGSTEEVNLTTGVDPGPAEDGGDPERIFPVFRAGWELMLFVVGTVTTAARLHLDR